MRLLVFWSVSSDYDRDDFDLGTEVDAFKSLWGKREDIGARFYDLDAKSYNDCLYQYGIMSVPDLEDDYNNEDLDGGYWCKVLNVPTKKVYEVINK